MAASSRKRISHHCSRGIHSNSSSVIFAPFLSPCGPPAAVLIQQAILSIARITLRSRIRSSSSTIFCKLFNFIHVRWQARAHLYPRRRRVNTRTSTTVPYTPGGTRKDVSLTSEAFSPKMARKKFFFWRHWVSPFGVTLPTEYRRASLPRQCERCRLHRDFSGFFADVRNIAGDFFSARVWYRAPCTSNSSIWMEVNTSSCTMRSEIKNRIFEVVTIPWHERHEQF